MKKLISKLTFIFFVLITIQSCTSNEKKVVNITDSKRIDSLNTNTSVGSLGHEILPSYVGIAIFKY